MEQHGHCEIDLQGARYLRQRASMPALPTGNARSLGPCMPLTRQPCEVGQRDPLEPPLVAVADSSFAQFGSDAAGVSLRPAADDHAQAPAALRLLVASA